MVFIVKGCEWVMGLWYAIVGIVVAFGKLGA